MSRHKVSVCSKFRLATRRVCTPLNAATTLKVHKNTSENHEQARSDNTGKIPYRRTMHLFQEREVGETRRR